MGLKRPRQDSVPPSEHPSSPSETSEEQPLDIKIIQLDIDEAMSDRPAVMKCSLPPHPPMEFASFQDYDVHYQQLHLNRCSECNNNFPDQHFLHLHISENHDPIRAAKADQGEKTFACLVSGCDRFCSTPQKRRLHCIDKHHFPRDYDFFVVNDGIDRRGSMLRPPRRRRSSTVNSTSSTTNRRRGESLSATKGEAMEIVHDEEKEDKEKNEREGQNEEGAKRAPMKLRGRGGFGHPRAGGRGRGRGRGRGQGTIVTPAPQVVPSTSTPTNNLAPSNSVDPMDGLTSRMSALQFVPHSLYARGKGRGRDS